MQTRYIHLSFVLVLMLFLTACTVNEDGQLVIQLTQMEAKAPEAEANDEVAFPPTLETVEVADGIYSFGNGEVFGAFIVTDEGVSDSGGDRSTDSILDLQPQPLGSFQWRQSLSGCWR